MSSLQSACASENASMASQSFSSALLKAEQFQLIRDCPAGSAVLRSFLLCLPAPAAAAGAAERVLLGARGAGLSQETRGGQGTAGGAAAPRAAH